MYFSHSLVLHSSVLLDPLVLQQQPRCLSRRSWLGGPTTFVARVGTSASRCFFSKVESFSLISFTSTAELTNKSWYSLMVQSIFNCFRVSLPLQFCKFNLTNSCIRSLSDLIVNKEIYFLHFSFF